MYILEDVVFYFTLGLCMALGGYYKRIDDLEMKRNYGAGLGLLVACLICGPQIYHPVLVVWGNIIIIKCCDKRYGHQMSLAYTWTYLVYLSYSPNITIYIIWLHQTIALRLVGLANEIHLAEQAKTFKSKQSNPSSFQDDSVSQTPDPSATDIITYSFFFIGLHKGPYYRWKIFEDHFTAPFGVLGDCRVITEHKLKKALVCCLGYLLLRIKYNPHAYYDEDFYFMFGNELRYLYSLPQLIMFFLHRQLIMLLCTSVFTETGFGVYPAKCMSAPGHGPTVQSSLLKLASTTTDVALKQEYNFAMLKCFHIEKIMFGPKMRDTLYGWDMATNYWFRTYIYRQTKHNKEIRSACSFATWWIWTGMSLPKLLMSATLWIYVQLEDEYSQLFDTNDVSTQQPRKMGFSLMRFFCLLYLTPCFIVSDTFTVLRYYNSMYWSYHILLLILIITLAIIYKLRSSGYTVALEND